MNDNFTNWGCTHLITLGVIALVITFLIRYGRNLPQQQRLYFARRIGLVMLLFFIFEYSWRLCTYGPAACVSMELLPLHFCAFMTWVSIIALWWQRPWACCLVYFGVLSASIQALITPVLHDDFPTIAFFNFFISHSLLLLAALVQTAVIGWRARRRDPILAVLIMDAYVLVIHPINMLLGSNYGFTAEGPANTLLAQLGPGPWYYLKLQIPALLLFYLMYLFVRQKAPKSEQAD